MEGTTYLSGKYPTEYYTYKRDSTKNADESDIILPYDKRFSLFLETFIEIYTVKLNEIDKETEATILEQYIEDESFIDDEIIKFNNKMLSKETEDGNEEGNESEDESVNLDDVLYEDEENEEDEEDEEDRPTKIDYLRMKLLNHQLFISAYMAYTMPYKGLLLYHGLGSGKTRTAINVCNTYINTLPHMKPLILLPATLKNVWMNELKKWCKGNEYNNYEFLTYNSAINDKKISKYLDPKNGKISHRIIVIDEVHNLTSMLTNKKSKKQLLYNALMEAHDCKIVAMSGTPIRNKPYELAILFNIIKGNMIYKGEKCTLFPEDEKIFNDMYINYDKTTNKMTIKNEQLFSDKITGIVSYFSSIVSEDYPTHNILAPVKLNFNDKHFDLYNKCRNYEKNVDKLNRKKSSIAKRNTQAIKEDPNSLEKEIEDILEPKSMFRMYSRLLCNYGFISDINRPYPYYDIMKLVNNDYEDQEYSIIKNLFISLLSKKAKNDNDLKLILKDINLTAQEYVNQCGGKNKVTFKKAKIYDELITITNDSLKRRITTKNFENYLDINSSIKMNTLCNDVCNCMGPAYIYTQFILLEGITILEYYFEKHGFEKLVINASTSTSNVDEFINSLDKTKKRYISYTGKLNNSEKNNILHIFNHRGNIDGNICKVIIGSSASSEGLSLRNVSNVYILEPYWNNIRTEQVIGRATRYKSHDVKNSVVSVHQYHMTLTNDQKKKMGEEFSTDEYIENISKIKTELNNSFLDLLINNSIDIAIHNKNTYKRNIKDNDGLPNYYPYCKNINTDADVVEKPDKMYKTISYHILSLIDENKNVFYYVEEHCEKYRYKNKEDIKLYKLYTTNKIENMNDKTVDSILIVKTDKSLKITKEEYKKLSKHLEKLT